MKRTHHKAVRRAIARYRRDLPAPAGHTLLCDRPGFAVELARALRMAPGLPAWAPALAALAAAPTDAEHLRVDVHPRLARRNIRCALAGAAKAYRGRRPEGCHRMDSGRVYAPLAGGAR